SSRFTSAGGFQKAALEIPVEALVDAQLARTRFRPSLPCLVLHGTMSANASMVPTGTVPSGATRREMPMRVNFVVALLIATGLRSHPIVLDPCRYAEEPDHPRGRCFSAEPAAACAHHEDPGDLPVHGRAQRGRRSAIEFAGPS